MPIVEAHELTLVSGCGDVHAPTIALAAALCKALVIVRPADGGDAKVPEGADGVVVADAGGAHDDARLTATLTALRATAVRHVFIPCPNVATYMRAARAAARLFTVVRRGGV